MKKRFWACLLSLSLLLTMMPTMAFATDETVDEPADTSEVCTVTDGCTLQTGHEGECVVVESEPEESENVPCKVIGGCTLENGHEGECVVAEPEPEEPESTPCKVTEGCTLENGHEGECVVVESKPEEQESVLCKVTEGCTLEDGHEGECIVVSSEKDDDKNDLPDEDKDIIFDQFVPEKVMESTDPKPLADADDWTECTRCSEDNPHLIATTADLDKIRTHIHTGEDGTQTITGYFKLANDIVFSDEDFEEGGAFYNDGWGWTPIGHNNKTSYFSGLKFCGEFDGNQCTVENIHINRPASYWYNGLFAGIGGTAWVHDLNLSGFQFHADNMGALCGQVYGTDAVIENITVTDCEFTALSTAAKMSGLLIGCAGGTIRNIEISDSRYERGSSAWAGGFITNEMSSGLMENVTVKNCYLKPYAYTGLLCATVSADAKMNNISITDCTVEPTHGATNYLVYNDYRPSATADTPELSNITIDVQIKGMNKAPGVQNSVMHIVPKRTVPENNPITLDNIDIKATYVDDDNDVVHINIRNNGYYILDPRTNGRAGIFEINDDEYGAILNGGIVNPVGDFTEDTLEQPVRYGYSFQGWYESEDSDMAATELTAGKLYYAKWEPSTYTVTSNLDFESKVYGAVSGSLVIEALNAENQAVAATVADNDIFDTAVNEEDHTITVTPRSDLSVGEYKETLYVTTPDGATFFVPVTLEVVRAGSELAIWANGSENLTLSGGGDVTLRITGDVNANEVTIACNGENIEIPANEDGTYTVTLPNETADYTFTATYAGDDNHEPAEDSCTVSVTRHTGGGGASHPEASDDSSSDRNDRDDDDTENIDEEDVPLTEGKVADFDDVPADAWFAKAVQYVYEHDLMTGVSENLFAPNAQMNRAMVAQILFNMEQPTDTEAPAAFRDVAADQWYAKAVNWAVWQGYMSGYGTGSFGPNDALTREQLVTVLWRYSGSPVMDNSSMLNTFSDATMTSDYAQQAMIWAYAQGVISGNADGTLNPQGTATRAEIAQMLMNYCENVK